MGIFSWIILGIIAGALAKLILPGKQGGGIIVTMILGIVGALLGGWVAKLLDLGRINAWYDPVTIITAVIGSIIVLLIYGLIVGRRR